jgi:hypothetical protein
MNYPAVMAGLVPAIHVLFVEAKTWMPGTRPGMTGKWSGLITQPPQYAA